MSDTSRKQNLWVLVGSVVVILCSVFLTLTYTGVLFGGSGSGSGGENVGFRNITFTDAVVTCRENLEDNYAGRIRSLVTDSHSSSYDDRQFLYKIFLQMDLFAGGSGEPEAYFVNCFIRSSNGSVKKFEVVEWEGNENKVDDGTNMFGVPRAK
ncbi:MAG: hypothetical protein ACI9Y1_001175 [Lentisphaeria bacterium]|jgi:hypothetical protein